MCGGEGHGEQRHVWKLRGGRGPYRCKGAGDPWSTSGYATADESLAMGSN